MDTINEALGSAAAALNRVNAAAPVTAAHLQTIATAAQAVEGMAAQTIATVGGSMTGAQKLQAGIMLASAIDPAVGQVATPLATLFGTVVNIFNMFGLFNHKTVAPTVQPAAPAAPAVAEAPSPSA